MARKRKKRTDAEILNAETMKELTGMTDDEYNKKEHVRATKHSEKYHGLKKKKRYGSGD